MDEAPCTAVARTTLKFFYGPKMQAIEIPNEVWAYLLTETTEFKIGKNEVIFQLGAYQVKDPDKKRIVDKTHFQHMLSMISPLFEVRFSEPDSNGIIFLQVILPNYPKVAP